MLVNPNNPVADSAIAELRAPAAAVGRTIEIFHASNGEEINRAFREIAERKAGGLLVVPDANLTTRMIQIVTLATRHRIPAIFQSREWAEAGGLMSYGANVPAVYRQAGGTPVAFLEAPSPPTCRSSNRPSSNSSSICKLPKRLISKSRRPWPPAPTR